MEKTTIFEAKTLPIWILGIVVLIIVFLVIIRGLKKTSTSSVLIDGIPILGLFSFSYPIILLIIGLFNAAESVSHAGEISSTLAWAGIRDALVPISMGLIVLHISAIGWFFAKRFKTK